ncbi:MAG: SPOR domain-containing protein [Desulfobacteraceae bacterium]|nr:SPOR domain-containing protein [Desulfobacteraceae bacterium]
MRIDYSEPKKSYVTNTGTARPRKEPSRFFPTVLVITAVITFIAGFGTGWFLSQKSAKKSFQAAAEQTSLENSPKTEIAPPPIPAQPVQTAPQQQPNQPATQQATGTAAEPRLSFYKTLPSGQNGNVLGSGINTKDDKGKQPLQAAIPANIVKPPALDAQKPPADKPAAPEKSTSGSNFTVQVASFPLRSEAETLKNRLAGKGYNAFVSESHQGDKGTWYRVRIGKKLEQEAAKELAGKLGKAAIVIPDRD